jgi:hypothetical protein
MIDLSKLDYCPLKPNVTFQLKPSLGSAFLPLQQSARIMMDEASGIINGEVSPTSAAVDTPSSNNMQQPPPPSPPPPPPPLVPQLQGMGIDSSAAHTPTPCSNDHGNDQAGI